MSLFFEDFKVGGKSKSADANKPQETTDTQNSGSNNVEKCPLTDDTLYCQVSRTAGITGMLVYILFIVILVLVFFYSLYYLFFRTGGSNTTTATGVSKAVSRRRR